jgi:hypothetical protein
LPAITVLLAAADIAAIDADEQRPARRRVIQPARLVEAYARLGAIERPPGTPPIPFFIAAVGPLIVFLAAYWGSPRFRAFVLTIDLPGDGDPGVAGWRAWILALYVHGVLPGGVRLAGRPRRHRDQRHRAVVAYTLIHRPGFASHRLFVLWNLLGILDLVVAVGVGGLSSALASGVAGK